MFMVNGLVSVIIPTFKRPGMLGRAIDSVLAQSYENIEIIVVDDNTDGDEYRHETMEFMNKYEHNIKVKYLKHQINLNGSAARNTGILNSVGEFIAFLDDDDYFLTGRIAEGVSFLKSMPENYGGVCSNYMKKYKNKVYKISNNAGCFYSSYELLSARVDFAAGSTLLIRRKVIEKIGLFDTSFYRHQDWEFLIRFFRFYKLGISSLVNVVICVDGIRNNPGTDQLLNIKKKLLETYVLDVDIWDQRKKISVYQAQWKEVVCNYLKERRYWTACKFGKTHIEISSYKITELVNLLISLIIGVFPKFMILIYSILNLKYKFTKSFV